MKKKNNYVMLGEGRNIGLFITLVPIVLKPCYLIPIVLGTYIEFSFIGSKLEMFKNINQKF